MFGIAVAQLSSINEAEKERYHELYCGLCYALKSRYNNIARLCLTYDLSFYIMLCNSLHEPAETRTQTRCALHPTKRTSCARSAFTDYAADLSVALAYHKCLDDWKDEKRIRAKASSIALEQAYRRAQSRIPTQCTAIEQSMCAIHRLEEAPDTTPDAAAHAFGLLLGQLFAYKQGQWAQDMQRFGSHLGSFIYVMDAAIDIDEDRKQQSYNPFAKLDLSEHELRMLLSVLAREMTTVFERLPLEQDLHLMRSVLYSGVWQKFNAHYSKESVAERANHD